MLTDNEYDALMYRANREDELTFMEAVSALEYMKTEGVYRFPELTKLDWLANALMLLYSIEE